MTRKLKIAFYYNDRKNYSAGPTINAVRVIKELHKRGHDIYPVVEYSDDYTNTKELISMGIKCHLAPYKKYTADAVKWFNEVLEKINPDIWVPNYSCRAGIASKNLLDAGTPCFFTHRSDDPLNWGQAQFFSNIKKGFYHSSIICVSEYLKNELESKTNRQDLVVIPSGVPSSNYISSQENEILSLVYAGRLAEKQKRFSDLLVQFSQIFEKYKKIKLTVIGGDENQIEHYQKITNDLKIQSSVVFKGYMSGSKYQEELSKHNCLILMSDYEGTPGAVMDGMSCGLIPIVLRYNGVDEIVKNGVNGFILETRNELIPVLNTLLLKPMLKKELSRNALNKFIESYSLEAAVDKWESIFQRYLPKIKPEVNFQREIILPKKSNMLKEDIRYDFFDHNHLHMKVIHKVRKIFRNNY